MNVPGGKTLHKVDTRNPKDVIIEGLKFKVESLGDLRVPFDITTDEPSRETYDHDLEGDRKIKRRIVVRKLQNTVKTYALGQLVGGDFNADENLIEREVYGHVDLYTMEISCWSPDSSDRDNIVELIKLWMLELEQEFQAGHIVLPYFYNNEHLAVKFLRAYEDINRDIYRNGPIYIGSLVYEFVAPFFHGTYEELQRYTIYIQQIIRDFRGL